jgi:hypothetical protein
MSSISKSTLELIHSANEIFRDGSSDKIGVFIKLDREVVEWFKESGPGYQRRMNEILKRFVSGVRENKDGVTEKISVLEKAQELFEKYYEQCFWHMRSDLIITENNLPQIIKGLRTYGGRSGFMEAHELCR